MKTRRVAARWLIGLPLLSVLCLLATIPDHLARAHNNPGFKEILLTTIDISDQPMPGDGLQHHSEAFSLDLPKKTIELIWKIEGDGEEGITFAVAQGDKLHAEGLTSGANSRILRGGDVRVVNVEGATAPFRLEIFANVIDRS